MKGFKSCNALLRGIDYELRSSEQTGPCVRITNRSPLENMFNKPPPRNSKMITHSPSPPSFYHSISFSFTGISSWQRRDQDWRAMWPLPKSNSSPLSNYGIFECSNFRIKFFFLEFSELGMPKHLTVEQNKHRNWVAMSRRHLIQRHVHNEGNVPRWKQRGE